MASIARTMRAVVIQARTDGGKQVLELMQIDQLQAGAKQQGNQLLKKVQEPGADSPFAEITDEDIDNLFND